MEIGVSVSNLAAERGGRVVFSEITFAVDPGTLLRISGANGAGKTTLLRMLAGLAAPSDGTVLWTELNGATEAAQAACFVGHGDAFNEALTVRDNLVYAAALAGIDTTPRSIELALIALGVAPLIKRRFGTLSQGQKKRCSLARLLLDAQRGARAWLLDEPFVALDTDAQAVLAALISAELVAGGLVIYTSHQAVEISATRTLEITL